jgi:Mg-chelatase subunit ChlD
MRICLQVLGVIACLSFVSNVSWAQEIGGGGNKANLDLPYDAGGDGTEEEDAPETILFYGQQYEGDGFFYTVDRSGSMQDSGELNRAKLEIVRNISEFSDRTEFGVNFFDGGIQKFPQGGKPASGSQKQAAIGWVHGTQGGSGSCCQLGLVTALQYANQSTAQRKVVVYVGDGGGTCHGQNEDSYLQQTMTVVTSQNYQRVQINTIGVLMQGRQPKHFNFLKQLAAANGGTYTTIN